MTHYVSNDELAERARLETAVRRHPGDTDYAIRLAGLYAMRGLLAEAERHFAALLPAVESAVAAPAADPERTVGFATGWPVKEGRGTPAAATDDLYRTLLAHSSFLAARDDREGAAAALRAAAGLGAGRAEADYKLARAARDAGDMAECAARAGAARRAGAPPMDAWGVEDYVYRCVRVCCVCTVEDFVYMCAVCVRCACGVLRLQQVELALCASMTQMPLQTLDKHRHATGTASPMSRAPAPFTRVNTKRGSLPVTPWWRGWRLQA